MHLRLVSLPTHRDSSCRISRPKALYAISHVLKTIPYFNDREHTSTLGITPIGPHTIVLKVPFGDFAESRSRDFGKEIVEEGRRKWGTRWQGEPDMAFVT